MTKLEHSYYSGANAIILVHYISMHIMTVVFLPKVIQNPPFLCQSESTLLLLLVFIETLACMCAHSLIDL